MVVFGLLLSASGGEAVALTGGVERLTSYTSKLNGPTELDGTEPSQSRLGSSCFIHCVGFGALRALG